MRNTIIFSSLLLGLAGCFEDAGGLEAGSDESPGSTSDGDSGDGDPGDGDGDPGDGDGDPGDGDGDPGDGDGDPGDGDGDPGDGDGEPAACVGSTACMAIPASWSGPVALYVGSEAAPPCPADSPATVHELDGDLDAPDAECGCECGAPGGLGCSSVSLFERGNNCSQLFQPNNWVLDDGECQSVITTSYDAFSVTAATLQTQGASCTPAAAEAIAEPVWASQAKSCEGSYATCDGGLCLPAAGEGEFDRVCVWADGDTTCPDGAFSEKHVFYDAVEDTRDCSECSCAAPTGSCGGNVVLTTQGCGLQGSVVGSVAQGQCKDIGSVPQYARWQAVIDAECQAQGGNSEGSANPTGAVTFCCAG